MSLLCLFDVFVCMGSMFDRRCKGRGIGLGPYGLSFDSVIGVGSVLATISDLLEIQSSSLG